MNNKGKDNEQQIRLLKFDCEMRAKALEIALALNPSNEVKLLEGADVISKFIFGIAIPKDKE